MAINMISVSALTLVAITTLGNFVHVSNGNVASDEVRLIHEITVRSKHHAHHLARPVKDITKPINVQFGLTLVQLLDFDEKNQVIVLSVWKHYKWVDELQSWDPTEYGGVDKVVLPNQIIWTPDIVLYDNIEKRDSELHKEKLILRSNGEVEWVPYMVYKSSCKVQMENFPFDEQSCSFKFGSWSYGASELNLMFPTEVEDDKSQGFDLTLATENIEWSIEASNASRSVIGYPCCPGVKYVDITFSLHIKRQWGFFFKFMLLPTILLSCAVLVIFWIPPNRPDRTGLGTSLLGSFMLLLILVTQISPPSESIKFVSYICSNMVLTFLATLFSAAMVNLSNKNTKVPDCVKKIFLHNLGWLLCVVPRPTADDKQPPSNGSGSDATTNPMLADKERQAVLTPTTPEPKPNHQADWQKVVKVLDHLVFLIFLVVVIICVGIFFPRP